MRYDNPPFQLGETFQGTDDDGNLINDQVLGKIYEFPAAPIGGGPKANKSRVSQKPIRAVALRNESGLSLLSKRLVRCTRTAGYSLIESVDGYGAVLAEKKLAVVDPYLRTDAVADDAIFWAIIDGTVPLLTPDAGAAFNGDIAVGAQLVCATAATTGTSAAGRVSNVTLPGQTGATAAFNAAANLVGEAMSARTTGETGEEILVNVTIRW